MPNNPGCVFVIALIIAFLLLTIALGPGRGDNAVPNLALLLAVAAAAAVAIYQVGRFSEREEALKQEEALRREARLQQQHAARLATLWGRLEKAFPFLRAAAPENLTAEGFQRAIRDTLLGSPTLGTFGEDALPAPLLPTKERLRHLYLVGKTGSGKTTYLEHLIARDLADGHGLCVMSPEGEFFRDRLLPLVPPERLDELIYFAPGHPQNPIAFNPLVVEPGQDPVRTAEDLFTIFRRIFSDDDLGARMQPILQNAFAVLVGRPGMTIWDIKHLLEDPAFRDELVAAPETDEYTRSFWVDTFPRYPKNADLPILNRLDRFLRAPALRRAICQPDSSFSIRDTLADGKILFLNLFGLAEENRMLIGQILLSKFQLELMRRELSESRYRPFYLYADEFQSFAGFATGTWRELLSRGRKYGVCLTLAHQYPAQLPAALQDEILGNVNSLAALALGGKDAQLIRRELLHAVVDAAGQERVEPIPAAALIEQRVGQAYAKYAGGRAVQIRLPPPLEVDDPHATARAIDRSWERSGASPAAGEATARDVEPEPPAPEEGEPESWRG